MRTIKIFHHPRCSKSRAALTLVENFAAKTGIPVNIVEYLNTPPTIDELQELQQKLGIGARELIRDSEEEYKLLQLTTADDAALLQAIADHPKLLQRPIVVFEDRAVIARPPELVSQWLQAC